MRQGLHSLELCGFIHSDSKACNQSCEQEVWHTAVADQEIRKGDQKPRISDPELRKIHCVEKSGTGDCGNSGCHQPRSARPSYQSHDIAYERQSNLTSKGHIGIRPSNMTSEHLLYILFRATVPYIFHRDTSGPLRLVGEAYAQGIVNAKMMVNDPSAQTIEIC